MPHLVVLHNNSNFLRRRKRLVCHIATRWFFPYRKPIIVNQPSLLKRYKDHKRNNIVIKIVRFRLECALSLAQSDHVDGFKSNVPRQVNISKTVDQPANTAVARHVCERENSIIFVYFVYAICYITQHLMTASSGNIEILLKQNRCFPREQLLSV